MNICVNIYNGILDIILNLVRNILPKFLERMAGFEPATSTLGRSRSTRLNYIRIYLSSVLLRQRTLPGVPLASCHKVSRRAVVSSFPSTRFTL